MSGKNIIFKNEKINKSNFYKNKKLFNIDDTDVNKYYLLKKNHLVQKVQLNILLDIMMMVSLDHYV